MRKMLMATLALGMVTAAVVMAQQEPQRHDPQAKAELRYYSGSGYSYDWLLVDFGDRIRVNDEEGIIFSVHEGPTTEDSEGRHTKSLIIEWQPPPQ